MRYSQGRYSQGAACKRSDYSKYGKRPQKIQINFYMAELFWMLYLWQKSWSVVVLSCSLITGYFFSIFRYRIKGIKNIIFYELPLYSTFYSEILNHMDTWHSHSDSQVNPVTCTVLYTKSNALRLAGVVGTNRCAHMISSDQQVHMFVTGDDES